jgi:hypothetical protein
MMGARSAPAVFCALLCAVLAVPLAPSRAQERGFPHDVPFVPTAQLTVDEMLRLAGVTAQDFVIDLGSGDGRIVITAARKFGARGLGVDLDFNLVIQSEESARQAGVADRVKFLQQDLFKTDLSQASVITTYLLPGVMLKLRDRLLALKPGTRVVSHDFDLGDWKPDQTTSVRKNVYLWIVPAQVAGVWRTSIELPAAARKLDLEFTQRYQQVSAHGRLDGAPAMVWEARITGERLSFVITDADAGEGESALYFEGRVSGDVIEGEITRGVGMQRRVAKWRAARIKR